MNWLDSNDLFGAFKGFIVVFLIYILKDYLFNQRRTIDVDKPIYGRHHSWCFYLKRLIARFLLKLGRAEDLSDQLRVFSEHDEMVSFARADRLIK